MKCPKCNTENPKQANFCMKRGVALRAASTDDNGCIIEGAARPVTGWNLSLGPDSLKDIPPPKDAGVMPSNTKLHGEPSWRA
jgi:hypothetical protein